MSSFVTFLLLPLLVAVTMVTASSVQSGGGSGQNILCPGGQYRCLPGQTCCRHAGGTWACCPYPYAICCSDMLHCCPHGYRCSLGTCYRDENSVPWSIKSPATPVEDKDIQETEVSQSQAGNDNSENTLPEISDKVETSLLDAADVNDVEKVICPGGRYICPYGNTCCPHRGGGYGCCPHPHATCCSDLLHCCPFGYYCSLGYCRKGALAIPWLEKKPAAVTVDVPQEIKKEDLVKFDAVGSQNKLCPGGQYKCSSYQTCCRHAGGGWGCCRFMQATCCSDMLHCCPFGTRCTSSGCLRSDGTSLSWADKTLAQPAGDHVNAVGVAPPAGENIVCPGSHTRCPYGNTCCPHAGGGYGCCPKPHATCCADNLHCCPYGYHCVRGGMCRRDTNNIPWQQKIAALPMSLPMSLELPAPDWEQPLAQQLCPGGASFCRGSQTCCKNFMGRWGCCRHPRAVCCSDGRHCCPSGFRCDMRAGQCVQGSGNTLSFLNKAWDQHEDAIQMNQEPGAV